MIYITASGSQTVATRANGLLLQCNAAYATGTIALAAGGTTFATITGPVAAGAQFRYNGLRSAGAITINPSATCDVTISLLNKDV